MGTVRAFFRSHSARAVLAAAVILLAFASFGPGPGTRRPPGARPALPTPLEIDGDVRVLGSDEQAGPSAAPLPTDTPGDDRPATIVVAPNGAPTGSGTVASPLDLPSALASTTPVEPGDRVLLRGGVYDGAFTSYLTGTETERITVMSYPGEWAILDGGTRRAATLNVQGHDVTYRSFEVMKSDPDRVSAEITNNPSDLSRARWSGVWVQAPRTKLINLVVHDNGDGIGMWRPSVGSEIYGCIIYNNGWVGADRPWGHAIYLQNDSGTMTIRDNVMFNNYAYGFHAYDSWGTLRDVVVTGNVSFENGTPGGERMANIFAGSLYGATDGINVSNNVTYHRPGTNGYNVRLGYPDQPQITGEHGSVAVRGNTIVGGSRSLAIVGWRSAEVVDNFVLAGRGANSETSLMSEIVPHTDLLGTSMTTYRWDGNRYIDRNGGETPRSFGFGSGATFERKSFSEWRDSMGFDAESSYATDAPKRSVIVRRNAYQRGRALISVLEWSGASRVSVNLSKTGLKRGQRYQIRDVQNLSAPPVAKGIYRGRPISVPLGQTSVAAPIGEEARQITHTPSDFGVFLLEPR